MVASTMRANTQSHRYAQKTMRLSRVKRWTRQLSAVPAADAASATRALESWGGREEVGPVSSRMEAS